MNNITSDDNLDQGDRIVEGIALSLVLFISLLLNAAVIGIVCKHRTLRSKPANIFVANLCVSNLVMMVFVVPFSLTTVFVNRHRSYSEAACQVNGFFSITSSVCIVMSLCCISLDRYIAVTRPTRYKTIVTTRRVGYALVVVWAQGLLYASLPLFGWSKYQYHPATLHCSPQLADECGLYFFLVFVGFLTPIVIMIITYLRIFITIRKYSRKVSTSRRPVLSGVTTAGLGVIAPLNTSPNNTESKWGAAPVTKPRESTRSAAEDSYTFEPTELSYRDQTEFFKQRITADVATATKSAATTRNEKNTKLLSIESDISHKIMRNAEAPTQNEPTSITDQRSRPKPHRVTMVLRRMQSRKRLKRQMPTAEYKVAKTGLLLLVIFLVLWMPYLVVHSCFAGLVAPSEVFRLAMWLVYMNGVANPLVYALMNSNVRKKFKVFVSNSCAACCCRRCGT